MEGTLSNAVVLCGTSLMDFQEQAEYVDIQAQDVLLLLQMSLKPGLCS